MIFSTDARLKNQQIVLSDEILKNFSIMDGQKLYMYLEEKTRKIFISTIRLDETLYFFRIPFIDIKGRLAQACQVFKDCGANIEKSNDVSLGTYALGQVWVTFPKKHTDLEEFENNFKKLLDQLEGMMPQSLKETTMRIQQTSFQERRLMFSIKPWSEIHRIEVTIRGKRVSLPRDSLKLLGFEKNTSCPIILSLVDEFPVIVAQFFLKKDSLVRITLRIADRPGTLAESARILQPFVDIKASDKIVTESGKYSEWRIYGLLNNISVAGMKATLEDIIKKSETPIVYLLDFRDLWCQ